MPKEIKSKLDQYAATLLIMGDEGKTLDEMVAWLKLEGTCVAKSTLSVFLDKQRQQRAQSQLLQSISSGAEQCKAVESEFARNQAPELETIIKLHRVIILNLTTLGQANPKLLSLADTMTQTVLQAISAKTKAELETRKLNLAEQKFQMQFCEMVLDKTVRENAERIAGSNMSQAAKIAAMRQATFKEVDALEASGEIKLPKRQ
ncbi:MAG TPA: hypothetical protein VGY56_10645 [Verrucomicrobiae bacterium]|nr:hypothetical protein [Verrucomicrobiae bacterium]